MSDTRALPLKWAEVKYMNTETKFSSNLSFTVCFSDVVLQCPIIQMQIKLTNCLSVFFSPDTWKPHSWRRHVFKFKESQAEICLFFFVRSQMLVGNRTIGNLAVWACSIKYDTSELGRSKRHVECLPNLDCHFSWQWNAKKSNHKGLKWSQLQRSQHKQGNSFKLILHPSS